MLVWKTSAIILVVIVGAAGVIGYIYYSETQKSSLVEISKQSIKVRDYLTQHPKATYEINKLYLTADGIAYSVYDNWGVDKFVGSVGEPTDGKEHYCWVVRWHDPTSTIMSRVNVFIDKNSLQIALVEEIV